MKNFEYKNKIIRSYLHTEYYIREDINPFQLVFYGKYKNIKQRIKNQELHVNARNDEGNTLLHYAVLYNQYQIAKYLLTQGAILNAETLAVLNSRNLPTLVEEFREIHENYSNINNNIDNFNDINIVGNDMLEYYPFCSIL